jgi:dihydrofolate reductase
VLVGRKTYEEYIDDFRAKKDTQIFVVTNRSGDEDKPSVKYIHGSADEILSTIERNGFSKVIVCGGGEFNGLPASAGRIDEIIISIQHVILGEGISLFGSFKPILNLELVSSNEDIKGVTQNRYKVSNEK